MRASPAGLQPGPTETRRQLQDVRNEESEPSPVSHRRCTDDDCDDGDGEEHDGGDDDGDDDGD
eukprot:4056016-Karenia_brevis.AAC.1